MANVEHTSMVVDTVSCTLSLLGVEVELTNGEVTKVILVDAGYYKEGSVALLGGYQALVQLHTAAGEVLRRIRCIQAEHRRST